MVNFLKFAGDIVMPPPCQTSRWRYNVLTLSFHSFVLSSVTKLVNTVLGHR